MSAWGNPSGRSFDEPDEPEREVPRCPYCGLIMSNREAAEQGACNDCYDERTADR